MPLAQLSRLPSSAKTARLRPGSGSGVWVPPPKRRAPVAMGEQFRRGRVGDVEDRHADVAPRGIGEVSSNDRMVQRVPPAAPAWRLTADGVHTGQPPAADDLGMGWLGHIDGREHVVGKALPMARVTGIAAADIPQPVEAQPVDRHKADLARLGGLRDVVNAQPSGRGGLSRACE
jgi:hypothetical protein